MTNKTERWYFYCEPCGFKKIVEGKDHGLVEIKTAPIPLAGANKPDDKKQNRKKYKLQDEERESISPLTKPQKVKVKCPKCGRGICAKALLGAFTTAYQEKEENEKAQKQLSDKRQRMIDGMPDKKRTAFEQQFDKLVGQYLPKNKVNKNNLAEFEKMIDALMQGKMKNESGTDQKEGNDPRHQDGSTGREVSGDPPRESGG